jgi:mismatch-specific thymine-DNA glycosylase
VTETRLGTAATSSHLSNFIKLTPYCKKTDTRLDKMTSKTRSSTKELRDSSASIDVMDEPVVAAKNGSETTPSKPKPVVWKGKAAESPLAKAFGTALAAKYAFSEEKEAGIDVSTTITTSQSLAIPTNPPAKRRSPGPAPSRSRPKTTTQTTLTNLVSPSKVTKPKPKFKRQTTTSSITSTTSSKYAPPSRYAHLPQTLPDSITPNLILLFVGHNPGIATATAQHAYAHSTNRFWPLLHLSGLTPDRIVPFVEDRSLPKKYSLGLTNIVSRPTKDTAELTKEEQANGTPILEEKVREYRPEAVCCVGKSVWEAIFRYKNGRPLRKTDNFEYGWQKDGQGRYIRLGAVKGEFEGARVFATTSTSGLAAGLSMDEKVAIWKVVGDWVNERRAARAETTEGADGEEV